MQYMVKIELRSQEEPQAGRNYNEDAQTFVAVKKMVEADTEKQALQKVVDLIAEGEK